MIHKINVGESQYEPDVSQTLGTLVDETRVMAIILPTNKEVEEKRKKQAEDFKCLLKVNNISYWKIKEFLFFELNKKHYLYIDFGKEKDYETLLLNKIKGKIKKFGCTCLDIGKIEKPTFNTEQKIYEMMRFLYQSDRRFYEKLSLEDIVYDSDTGTYFILTKKKSIEIFSNEVEIHWSNLFSNKSPYTFKGNEIQSYEHMEIINRGGRYGNNTSW